MKTTKAIKSHNNVKKERKVAGSGNSEYAEEESHFFGKEIRGSIFKHSDFSCVKDGEAPHHQAEELNKLIPYACFKMEGLLLLKGMLLSGDVMCKIKLKDAFLQYH